MKKFLVKAAIAIWLALLVFGCSPSTRTTLVHVGSPTINPSRPVAIDCPPIQIKVIPNQEDDLISKTSHANLKTCLNDTIRYVDDSQTLFRFYESRE